MEAFDLSYAFGCIENHAGPWDSDPFGEHHFFFGCKEQEMFSKF